MVYKLRKATRFMFIKVFIGITIFSLIIGAIASAIVGIAITFDNISYSPSLVNIDGGNIGLEECEEYRSESCDWLLYDEIRDREDIKSNLLLNNELAMINRTLATGSNIVITRPNTDEDEIEPVFLGRLLSINPLDQDVLCEEFSFLSSQNEGLCNISPIHIKSEILSDNSTRPVLVGEILVANRTNEDILCSDFTNKFDCKLKFNSNTGLYEANLIDVNFDCSQAGGTILIREKKDICLIEGKRQLVSPQFLNQTFDTSILPFPEEPSQVFCTFGTGECSKYAEPIGMFGFLSGIEEGIPGGNYFFVKVNNFQLLPSVIVFENVLVNQELIYTDLIGTETNIAIGCYIKRDITAGLRCVQEGEVFVEHKGNILDSRGATDNPKLLIRRNGETLNYKFGLLYIGEAKDVFQVLPFILNGPVIANALENTLPTVMNLIVINVAIAIVVSIFGIWRRVGGRLTTRFALAFKGRIGKLLELTQFFQFSGDWYLEAIAVHDYNFAGYRPAFKELITERWRDTIFFPVALAATLSVLLVTVTNKPENFWSILIIAPILPILLTFWTPFIWTMQDSGLKRVNWGETGDVNAIERVSNIVRDGFNKLVGIGAILGLGTAGSTAIRANITGTSFDDQFLISSLESLLAFNLNFIVSTGLWTIGLFFLICAASLPGVVLASLVYLNRGQIDNVKRLREQMKRADIMFGTSTQMMQEHDVSIYYDSSKKDEYSIEDSNKREIKSFIDVPDVYDKDDEENHLGEEREKKLDKAEKDGSLDIVDDYASQDEESENSNEESDNNDT